MRYQFTDESWAVFGTRVSQVPGNRCGQKPKLPERMFFEALLYVARTGIPWRDLPAEFGCWLAVYQRFRRWVDSGRLFTLFELLTETPDFGDVRRVLVDSTIIRAHQHAAGARRKKRIARRRRLRLARPSVAVAAA
ncbi:MAG: transposase [Gemmataceae bacterium]